MLGIISCHFNPMGYSAPIENWWRWREHIEQTWVDVISVELSFDGNFHTDSEIQIVGDPEKHLMWQKESLLNIALKNLSPDINCVAWIDADVIFHEKLLTNEVEAALHEKPLVQLFKQITLLDEDGTPGKDWPSAMATNRNIRKGKSGYAWAARRKLLDKHGLYSHSVAGSGDNCILNAAFGKWQSNWAENHTAGFRSHWLPWAARFFADVRGKVGMLPKECNHLWHGSSSNRGYLARHHAMRDAGHDVVRDVYVDDQGLMTWTDEAPDEVKLAMKNYFVGRREDG